MHCKQSSPSSYFPAMNIFMFLSQLLSDLTRSPNKSRTKSTPNQLVKLVELMVSAVDDIKMCGWCIKPAWAGAHYANRGINPDVIIQHLNCLHYLHTPPPHWTGQRTVVNSYLCCLPTLKPSNYSWPKPDMQLYFCIAVENWSKDKTFCYTGYRQKKLSFTNKSYMTGVKTEVEPIWFAASSVHS